MATSRYPASVCGKVEAGYRGVASTLRYDLRNAGISADMSFGDRGLKGVDSHIVLLVGCQVLNGHNAVFKLLQCDVYDVEETGYPQRMRERIERERILRKREEQRSLRWRCSIHKGCV